MTKIKHEITLFHQTPEILCGPTSLAMQLSSLGLGLTPSVVANRAQPFKRPGDPGFIAQELATFCLSLGLCVDFYSFDGRVLDFSWQGMGSEELRGKLEHLSQCQSEKPVNETRLRYILSYLEFIKAGGSLRVEPFVTTRLILQLLEKGPVGAAVAFNVLVSEGKRDASDRFDPYRGSFGTHSIVVYGYSEGEGFLVADPSPGRGEAIVGAEHLLAAITAAQIEDDNAIFLITKR